MSEWPKELASKASSPARGSWVRIPLSPPCDYAYCDQEPSGVPCGENFRTVSGPDGSSTKGDLSGDVGKPCLVLGHSTCSRVKTAGFVEAVFFLSAVFVCLLSFYVYACQMIGAFVAVQDLRR